MRKLINLLFEHDLFAVEPLALLVKLTYLSSEGRVSGVDYAGTRPNGAIGRSLMERQFLPKSISFLLHTLKFLGDNFEVQLKFGLILFFQ